MIQVIFILFAISFTYGTEAEDLPSSLKSTSDAQEDQLKSVPKFDKNNPQAKGVILSFHRLPNEQEEKLLLKKTQAMGLKKTKEIEDFKSWVLEWPEWKKGKEAIEVCNSLSNLSFLEYCEPEYLLGPATGYIRKKVKKKAHKRLKKGGSQTEPKGGPKLNPKDTFSPNQTGDVRFCKIFSSQLGLFQGELSDYWAQEMIGSDLLKKELEKLPPVEKNLVAVFDTPYGNRHDKGVKNIISDKGKHAVLPEIGNSMTKFDVSLSSYYLDHSSRLLRIANKKCKAPRPIPQPSHRGGSVR